jgi:hypothetical protein
VSYKNWTFSGLLDIKRGGDIYSITNWFGEYAGVLASTLKGREVDWDNPGVVVDGIVRSSCGPGSGVITNSRGETYDPSNKYVGMYRCVGGGTANTVNRTAEDYFQAQFGQNSYAIFDGSYVKLRELRVSFELPREWASRMYASAINVALSGRNLHTWTKVPNIDPEFSYTTGNLQGIEYGIIPNPRAIGFSVRVTP